MCAAPWGSLVSSLGEEATKISANQREMNKEKAHQLLQGLIEGNIKPMQQEQIGEEQGYRTSDRPLFSTGQSLIGKLTGQQPQYYTTGSNVKKELEKANLTYMQNVNKQMATANEGELIYRHPLTGAIVPQEQAIQDMKQSGTKYIVTQKRVSKSGVTEVPVVTPPTQAQTETEKQGAMAKLLEMRNSLIAQKKTFEGGFLGLSTLGNMEKLKSIDKQIENIDNQIKTGQLNTNIGVDDEYQKYLKAIGK